MINISEEAELLCTELARRGFNGVGCEVNNQLFSFEDDDYWTQEEFDKHIRNYANIIVVPFHHNFDNEYSNFNKNKFNIDFKKMLHDRFGHDVHIEHHEYTREWEIYRIGGA